MKFRSSAFSPGKMSDIEEADRLSTLWGYDILDTLPERGFDDLAEAAAKACGTPYAFITFVDKERLWFKAKVGLDLTQVGRERSFCHFCVHNAGKILEIPDTLEDELFKDDPLVVQDPYIRFYAGAPIQVKEGHSLGAVCVMDQRPRTLSSEQRRILQILADRVRDELEARLLQKRNEADHQQEISRLMVESETEERRRIGQELHDGVVQTLAAAHMQVELLRDDTQGKEEQKKVLDHLQAMIDQASNEVRNVGHSLMGKKVREKGLRRAIEDLAADYSFNDKGPDIMVEVGSLPACLGELEALNIYRVVQEFIHNSIKHADASLIGVRSGISNGRFWMNLYDDGKGTDPESIENFGGVRNMERRVRSLGGRCHFASSPGEGVSLKLELDLDRTEGEELKPSRKEVLDHPGMGHA